MYKFISGSMEEKQKNSKHKAIVVFPDGNNHPLVNLNSTPIEADKVYNEWFDTSPKRVLFFKDRWVVDVGGH